MTYALPLYDALTGINVPKDQARAVVESLEHKLTSELATKSDIEQLRLATKADIDQLRLATKADIEQLRTDFKSEIARMGMDMTIRMGVMGAGYSALLFAALRWSSPG